VLILILGILIFLGVHVFATLRPARAAAIETYGLQTYKRAYAVVAGLGLVLVIWGFSRYRAEGIIQIWDPPGWTRHLAMPLVWFAFVALASRRAARLDAFTRGDAIALGVGTALFALVLVPHPYLFGVSVLRG
jgi:uncharacterized membrane protein